MLSQVSEDILPKSAGSNDRGGRPHSARRRESLRTIAIQEVEKRPRDIQPEPCSQLTDISEVKSLGNFQVNFLQKKTGISVYQET